MKAGRILPILLFGLACAGIPAFLTLAHTAKWVGSTDVAIQFVVIDTETGEAIPNAVIEVNAEQGGFCEDPGVPEFTFQADESGTVTHLSKRCMCFGSKSVFEDTFVSYLPPWRYRASAPGYVASDFEFLEAWENSKNVRRGKPYATLSLRIRLRKSDSVQVE